MELNGFEPTNFFKDKGSITRHKAKRGYIFEGGNPAAAARMEALPLGSGTEGFRSAFPYPFRRIPGIMGFGSNFA